MKNNSRIIIIEVASSCCGFLYEVYWQSPSRTNCGLCPQENFRRPAKRTVCVTSELKVNTFIECYRFFLMLELIKVLFFNFYITLYVSLPQFKRHHILGDGVLSVTAEKGDEVCCALLYEFGFIEFSILSFLFDLVLGCVFSVNVLKIEIRRSYIDLNALS